MKTSHRTGMANIIAQYYFLAVYCYTAAYDLADHVNYALQSCCGTVLLYSILLHYTSCLITAHMLLYYLVPLYYTWRLHESVMPRCGY
jgi:hypothetical protein